MPSFSGVRQSVPGSTNWDTPVCLAKSIAKCAGRLQPAPDTTRPLWRPVQSECSGQEDGHLAPRHCRIGTEVSSATA